MTQNERIERLEFILGTLIGSLWAAGELDQATREELHYLIESNRWPIAKSVGRVSDHVLRERTG